MNQDALYVLTALPRIGAFKLGAFRLKHHESQPDAPLSPFYIDLRLIRSYPVVLERTARAMSALVRPLKCDLLGDIPTAATPIVAVMVVQMDVPMISPRMESKTHGSGAEIDGKFDPGETVVAIDDLVTRADSKFAAIGKFEAVGLRVQDVAVFLDRQQGGGAQLNDAGYNLHSVATADDLFAVIYRSGTLSSEAQEICEKYRRNELPSGWQNDVKEGWDQLVVN